MQVIFHAAWWLHAVLLLSFLVFLPYSKHLHIMAAPFNVFFAPQTPKGRFPTADLENSETFGVGSIEEFTWKDLFDTYNCTECGRCTSGCPANISGKELDPKWLILNLREHLLEGGQRLLAKAGNGGAEAPRMNLHPWWAASSRTTSSGPARPAAGAWTRAPCSSSTCRRSWTCAACSS